MHRLKNFGFFTLLALLIIPIPSVSQTGPLLEVSPEDIEMNVVWGNTGNTSILVKNIGDAKLLDVAFTFIETSATFNVTTGRYPHIELLPYPDIAGWTTFEKNNFDVDAGDSVNVTLAFSPPPTPTTGVSIECEEKEGRMCMSKGAILVSTANDGNAIVDVSVAHLFFEPIPTPEYEPPKIPKIDPVVESYANVMPDKIISVSLKFKEEPTQEQLDILKEKHGVEFIRCIPGLYSCYAKVQAKEVLEIAEYDFIERVVSLTPELVGMKVISEVKQFIEQKEKEGFDVTEAKQLLEQARSQFTQQNYTQAEILAYKAAAASVPSPPKLIDWVMIVVIILIVVMIIGFILTRRKLIIIVILTVIAIFLVYNWFSKLTLRPPIKTKYMDMLMENVKGFAIEDNMKQGILNQILPYFREFDSQDYVNASGGISLIGGTRTEGGGWEERYTVSIKARLADSLRADSYWFGVARWTETEKYGFSREGRRIGREAIPAWATAKSVEIAHNLPEVQEFIEENGYENIEIAITWIPKEDVFIKPYPNDVVRVSFDVS